MSASDNASSRDDLLATVSSLYYILNQSQSAIAERLDLSTSKVSRLIREARDKGIVEIRIKMPIPRDVALEQALVDQFGLKDAYVLLTSADNSNQTRKNAIGQLAAHYIERTIEGLPAGATVGVAWGTGVHSAVVALPDETAHNIDVVPLIGGVGTLAIDSPDVARVVAQKLGGRHYDLHAPMLVERPEVRDVLLSEPAVQSGLQRAKAVHLAITGIGTVVDESSSFLRAGLLSANDLANLRGQGIVGEICGHFYDIHGNFESFEINRRIIGLSPNELRKVSQVLAVAHGIPKIKAIFGALAGHYVNVLFTDDITARGIMAVAQQNKELTAR
jgi:deoxyribonucleoside regulator